MSNYSKKRFSDLDEGIDAINSGEVEAVKPDGHGGWVESTESENLADWYNRNPQEFILAHTAAAIGLRMVNRLLRDKSK
ncbi:hypothetical protein F3N42_07250 [Marinihelvus fidelis]|uniref:Uncharacterized protein n=1 Tax=Marinihelvus fidelis TaxID=2613842 RepID=A0A5N0TAH5_9GAMM|nr:hypothetical protein [Marinihelvus fidelis]KAA9131962.1 hypothetical protein F3N42_07250 [Marinihelvus fidelis]